MTRPWIWDRLDALTQERVIEYFSADRRRHHVPAQQLAVVPGRRRRPSSARSAARGRAQDIADDLAPHDSFVRADGWISDGAERVLRPLHRLGAAPVPDPVVAHAGRGRPRATGVPREDVAALDRYLVGRRGPRRRRRIARSSRDAASSTASPPPHRSGPASWPTCRRRRGPAAPRREPRPSAHFDERGAPDDHGPSHDGLAPRLAPTRAVLLRPGITVLGDQGDARHLPARRPPGVDGPDGAAARSRPATTCASSARPAGSSPARSADGIVRVVNHGTDHCDARVPPSGDSPIYTRLGYCTATAPLHDSRAWREPLEQSVVLVDDRARASHRAGMQFIDARLDGDGRGRRIRRGCPLDRSGGGADPPRIRYHRRHDRGRAHPHGRRSSAVRGSSALSTSRVVDSRARTLRVGGWPLASDTAVSVSADASLARVAVARGEGELESSVRLIVGSGTAAVVDAERREPARLRRIRPDRRTGCGGTRRVDRRPRHPRRVPGRCTRARRGRLRGRARSL